VLAGCHGSSPQGTLVISDLQVTPPQSMQYDGDGTVQMTITFSFIDPSESLTTAYLDSSAGDSGSVPISGAGGQSTGTIELTGPVSTTTLGHYQIAVYVADAKGRTSNTLTGTFDVVPNDTASHWRVQSLPPASAQVWLKRVRWTGSMFVAVGGDVYAALHSRIFTSTDGETWTEQPSVLLTTLNDVTWAGSQFVAVGDGGTVLTSTDGIVWEQQTVPSGALVSLTGVAASSTTVVAVGGGVGDSAGTVMVSADGKTWAIAPPLAGASLSEVVWAGNQFVAVGSSIGTSNAQAVAATSPDGMTWAVHAIDGYLSVLYDVAWNGSIFVAVGYPGAATSADGISWQQPGAGTVGAVSAIAWSGHRFLTCGVVYCASTTDGATWEGSILMPGIGPDVFGLAWSDAKWVAVGQESLVLTSP